MPAPSGRVPYYNEYHSNINAITLSLKVPPSGLTCKITPDALGLIPASQTSSDQPHHVTLPSHVFPTKTTLNPSSAHSEAAAVRAELEARIERCRRTVEEIKAGTAKYQPKRVMFFEWTDPIYPGGHWTPEMIELAGGVHPIKAPAQSS
ncbi:hypothetical protein BGZ74_006022, partial [Mortierella antarctica]